MKLKKLLYLILFIPFLSLSLDNDLNNLSEQEMQQLIAMLSSGLLKIKSELDRYYPHPEWMFKLFARMSPEDFVLSFGYIVDLVGNKLNRWYYLYDSKELLWEDEKDINEFLDHFEIYYKKLNTMAMNVSSKKFVFFNERLRYNSEFERNGEIYLPAKIILKAQLKDAFDKFFALYFKYLSITFLQACKKSYNTQNKSEYTNEIKKSFYQMVDLFQDVLSGTRYYPEALRCIMKYYPLMSRVNGGIQ